MEKSVKRAYILVDMVNGFVNEGAMADKYISHIIPKQYQYMKEIEASDDSINIIIKDMHKPNCR